MREVLKTVCVEYYPFSRSRFKTTRTSRNRTASRLSIKKRLAPMYVGWNQESGGASRTSLEVGVAFEWGVDKSSSSLHYLKA
jgi:hypothetical protein